MAESLAKSLKRNSVYLNDLWTAADVLRLLPTWVDDDRSVDQLSNRAGEQPKLAQPTGKTAPQRQANV